MRALLLANAISTIAMCGIIWLIQVVHYPLFARVGAAAFPAYHAAHTGLITLVVFPLMTVELFSALGLALLPPPQVPAWVLWVGAVLVMIIWALTVFDQLPNHVALANGFDAAAHARLVAGNWGRTLIWTARAVLMVWVLWAQLSYTVPNPSPPAAIIELNEG
jgi:hypothetical protein